MNANVFDLGHQKKSMAMECILVYGRVFLCGYVDDLTFLWVERHLPV